MLLLLKTFLLTLVLYIAIGAQSGSGKAYYQVSSNTLEDSSGIQAFSELLNTLSIDRSTILIAVTFDNSFINSVTTSSVDNPYETSFASIQAQEHHYCYDIKNKTIMTQGAIGDSLFQVKEVIDHSSWKFIEEKKTINGYSCLKAEKTHWHNGKEIKTIVWYTNDIPLPIGPGPYFDFPGVVVQLKNRIVTFQLAKLDFSQEAPVCEIFGTEIYKEHYNKKRREAFVSKWKRN